MDLTVATYVTGMMGFSLAIVLVIGYLSFRLGRKEESLLRSEADAETAKKQLDVPLRDFDDAAALHKRMREAGE